MSVVRDGQHNFTSAQAIGEALGPWLWAGSPRSREAMVAIGSGVGAVMPWKADMKAYDIEACRTRFHLPYRSAFAGSLRILRWKRFAGYTHALSLTHLQG